MKLIAWIYTLCFIIGTCFITGSLPLPLLQTKLTFIKLTTDLSNGNVEEMGLNKKRAESNHYVDWSEVMHNSGYNQYQDNESSKL